MTHKSIHSPFNVIVIVAALGYFVDIYDLILFGIVRNPSLFDLFGVTKQQVLNSPAILTYLSKEGTYIFNLQMIGMLVGGIIWGVLGDKRGRLSVLFGTIIMYSLANIANGFVSTFRQYEILRFIAGVGLAGELGVGITLVSEVMSKERRGYGTTMVSGIGIAGAVLGFLIADKFNWRVAYWTGGGLGIALLILRVVVFESGMFENMKKQTVKRGSFISLFIHRNRFRKYLYSILIGMPVWYVIGILVIFSYPEFSNKVFHIKGEVNAGKSVMYHYIGASLGSFVSGIISQWLQSRKKALLISLVSLTIFIAVYFAMFDATVTMFYIIIFLLGLAQGYWAIFVTVASEQFGTNLRATVTTTVPNFVRGSAALMALSFQYFSGVIGIWASGLTIGIVVMTLAFFALYKLEETFGKDLDYIETI